MTDRQPRRISDRVASMVEQAIEGSSTASEVVYDVGMGGNDSGPVLIISFWMPSPYLGQYVHVSAVLSNPAAVTQAEIDRLLPSALETMREERSKALRMANGEKVTPPSSREIDL